jgi:hypothetical protein
MPFQLQNLLSMRWARLFLHQLVLLLNTRNEKAIPIVSPTDVLTAKFATDLSHFCARRSCDDAIQGEQRKPTINGIYFKMANC